MVISPIILIVCAAILIFTLIFCIVNRPRKPVFTGVFMFLLLCFVIMTFFINIQLSSIPTSIVTNKNFINAVVEFITMSKNPTQTLLSETFSLFCKIDIGLIIVVILSMIIEVKNLFSQNKKK